MPKVPDKGDKTTRGRKKCTRTSPRKKMDLQPEDSLGDSDAHSDRDGVSDRSSQGIPAVEEKIAQFFEDRPYFYDISHEDYKNK
jgi:hypothetical protein